MTSAELLLYATEGFWTIKDDLMVGIQMTVPATNEHLLAPFAGGEIQQATLRRFRIVHQEGPPQVKRRSTVVWFATVHREGGRDVA
jgi:hypothetical protein